MTGRGMHSKPTIRGLNSEPISDWSVDASSVKFVDGEGLFWLFIVDEFDRKVMGTEVVPKIDDTTIISMLSNVIARHGSRPRGISLYGGVFNLDIKADERALDGWAEAQHIPLRFLESSKPLDKMPLLLARSVKA